MWSLQEVDKYQEYLTYLSKTYSGVYKKREKGDGCALFYNRERYVPRLPQGTFDSL